MPNCIIGILSFIIILFVTIVYFNKSRINSFETKLYGYLIIIDLFITIFAVSFYFVTDLPSNLYVLRDFVGKGICILFVSWYILFAIYLTYLLLEQRNNKNKKRLYFYIYLSYFLFFVFISTLIISLPLYYHSEELIKYSYGPSANVVFLGAVMVIMLSIITLIINHKNLLNKKYIPIYINIALAGITWIVQRNNPGILLTSFCDTFLTLIMFFTIENPDVKMIEQLNILKEQADRANNAKTEFLSSMSHEIRTPLNAIVGFSNTLNENPKLPDELKDEVHDILTASDNLLEIVNGVLDISKIEANKIEIVKKEYDTKKMFEELCKLTKSRIGTKPIEFVSKIDKSIPRVLYGDSVRVKQVILNLLTNAAKYTDEGKIVFSVNSVKKDNIIRLIVSVEDTGRGIKEENINKLFNKFERLDEEHNTTIEGTGLGLAITKKLVELMHGNIVVQSKFGKGSKFTVSIDQGIVDKPTINLDETTVIIESMNLSKKKILLVDDNKLNIKVACKLLEPYKADITTLLSGEETIELLKKDNKYDLILLDDMMPKMSGTDTFNKIKEDKLFDGPIVVLTANALTGEKEKYLEIGFDDYLAKPIENIELNRVLKKYLKK